MSSDNENGFDSTSSRTRKRMLPSVAEIARELSRRTGADAASILTTSRKVCAEELVRIKEGHESAPVEALVERAKALLDQEARPADTAFSFEPPPLPPAPLSAPAAPLAEGADPFGETSGHLDLRWEGEGIEARRGHGEEVPPVPRPTPFEMSFRLPDEPPGGSLDQGPAPVAPPPFAFNLEEPFAPEPGAASGAPAIPAAPFQQAPARRSKLPVLLGAALLVVAGGGAAWYFLSGPSKPSGPPPPLAVKRKPAPPEPSTSQPPAPSAPADGQASAAAPASAAPAAPASAAPASAPPAPAQPTPALPANPSWVKSAGAPPATVVPAQPTAAPQKKAEAEKPKPAKEPKPAPVVVERAQAKSPAKPEPAAKAPSVSVAPEPVPVQPKPQAPTPAPAPVAAKPAAEKAAPAAKKAEPAAPQAQTRAGSLVTPDWTAAPVFVVHFSSFQEKARAEKHAAQLSKEFGLPVRAVAVDLGEKGTWYRSVAGEFQTADEALALRTQLLAKGTPGVGLVYRMSGKK